MNRKPLIPLLLLIFLAPCCHSNAGVLPFVKHYEAGDEVFRPDGFSIMDYDSALKHEAGYLEQSLEERGFRVHQGGLAVRLVLSDPGLPEIHSDYHESIRNQGYHLQVSGDGILVEALSPQGIFYAITTLLQLIGPGGGTPRSGYPGLARFRQADDHDRSCQAE